MRSGPMPRRSPTAFAATLPCCLRQVRGSILFFSSHFSPVFFPSVPVVQPCWSPQVLGSIPVLSSFSFSLFFGLLLSFCGFIWIVKYCCASCMSFSLQVGFLISPLVRCSMCSLLSLQCKRKKVCRVGMLLAAYFFLPKGHSLLTWLAFHLRVFAVICYAVHCVYTLVYCIDCCADTWHPVSILMSLCLFSDRYWI